MSIKMTNAEIDEQLFSPANVNIADKCAHLPLTLKEGNSLPEPFIRHALTHIGRVKTASVIDDTVNYINHSDTMGIADFKKSVRATIYKNRDFLFTLYKLIVACSGTLDHERKMTPVTIELLLLLANVRSRTSDTVDKNRKALAMYFIDGEGMTEVSLRTGIAKPNVTRAVKRAREKFVLANELLQLLIGEPLSGETEEQSDITK